jgi:hypothetical protein
MAARAEVRRRTVVLVPSKRQLVVLRGLHAYEVAAAVFATTPLSRRDYRHPLNLTLGLKSEQCGAAVADNAPYARATSATIDDKDALTVALGAGTDANVCHGKFAALNGAFA